MRASRLRTHTASRRSSPCSWLRASRLRVWTHHGLRRCPPAETKLRRPRALLNGTAELLSCTVCERKCLEQVRCCGFEEFARTPRKEGHGRSRATCMSVAKMAESRANVDRRTCREFIQSRAGACSRLSISCRAAMGQHWQSGTGSVLLESRPSCQPLEPSPSAVEATVRTALPLANFGMLEAQQAHVCRSASAADSCALSFTPDLQTLVYDLRLVTLVNVIRLPDVGVMSASCLKLPASHPGTPSSPRGPQRAQHAPQRRGTLLSSVLL
mmetsp:Transcript_1583/g.4749  ORF Transcript_1583/g.4749 Transcript_1583/m.4749 type:complete len:270 (+) Transcript_1583:909-1718(+)